MEKMIKKLLLVTVLLISGLFISSASLSVQAAPIDQSAPAQTTIPGTLRDLQFVSAHTGWVLIENQLYYTTNSGVSWQEITPNMDGDLRSALFLNSHQGFTVWSTLHPNDYVQYNLASTQDGGQTWDVSEIVSYPVTSPDSSIEAVYLYFLNSQTGWVTLKRTTSSNFSVGRLFATTDSGKTWTQKYTPLGEPVTFLDEETGFITGGPTQQELYRTTDSGSTWQAVNLPVSGTARYTLPYFPKSMQVELPIFVDTAAGTELRVLSSADQGGTWQESGAINISPEQKYLSPTTFNGSTLYVVAPDALITYTSAENVFQTTYQAAGQDFAKIQMVDDNTGWGILKHSNCTRPGDPTTCTNVTDLVKTTNSGADWEAVLLPDVLIQTTETADTIDPRAVIKLYPNTDYMSGQGFDMCEIANLNPLKTWKSKSPFNAVNLYIGGISRACANSNLSQDFVESLSEQGWKFIPTWVGHQASCSIYSYPMSSGESLAYNQGKDNAIDAARVAWKLGLKEENSPGSVIYYDLEAFDTTNLKCLNAAKAFINGWVEQLHAYGIQAGVYGSVCASGLDEFYTLDNPPDVIWPALWTADRYQSSLTPDYLPCVTDTLWGNHQRIWQYTGAHMESWGGVSMYVDLNAIDGIVADISDLVGVPNQTLQNTSFETATLSPWQISPNSSACNWTLTSNSDNARTGDYALLLNKTSSQTDCVGVGQNLSFTPIMGDKYRFAVWVRSASSTDNRSVRLSITGTGTNPESTSYKFSGIKDTWSCIEVDHTITKSGLTGLQAGVQLENDDGIDVHLDDAHLSLNTGNLCPNEMTPTNIEASLDAFPDKIWVTWDDVPNATYYKILRAYSPNGSQVQAGISETTEYLDENLNVEQAYTYWVEACTPNGCGAASSYAIGTTSSPFILFSDDFESGDLNHWSAFSNKPALDVCSTNAMYGQYSLCINMIHNEVKYAAHTLAAPTNEVDIRFWLDPNTATFNEFVFLQGTEKDTGAPTFQIALKKDTAYYIQIRIRDNQDTWISSAWHQIADAPNLIRFTWNSTRLQARAVQDFTDITLSVNGVQKESINNILNHRQIVDQIQVGSITGPTYANIAHSVYIDELILKGPHYFRFTKP